MASIWNNPGERIRAGAILLILVGISLLHYLTPERLAEWHYIYQRLFYLPVIYAALHFGWRGGLATAIFAWVFYFPPFRLTWRDLPHYLLSQYLEVVVFCLAGILTGVLADRDRKQREMLRRRSEELSAVYRELQENFERMKRAERLYAVGQLSAGLAHEIRNPLASIAGAAGLLRRDRVSEQRQKECLDIITRECERLGRLLTSFLDFARPRPPRFQSTDLNEVIDGVITLSSHAAGTGRIALRKEAAPELPPIECDPEQLRQVLLNLTINAIQAMPEGGEIVVSARLDQDRVLLQVRDQGHGVDPDNMEKIFDPFFTTKETGTGLGLSVAHQTAEQLRGVLTAEPNPDRGMTFSLALPVDRRQPI
ncbi:MAG: sensor histidine kinase [Bryobacteraceae bacterium]